jgi:transposase
MQVLYTPCAGLDVHKKTVVACLLTPDPQGGGRQETRSFSTMTPRSVGPLGLVAGRRV